jgi:hypothetical protein
MDGRIVEAWGVAVRFVGKDSFADFKRFDGNAAWGSRLKIMNDAFYDRGFPCDIFIPYPKEFWYSDHHFQDEKENARRQRYEAHHLSRSSPNESYEDNPNDNKDQRVGNRCPRE